jgi:16S rRNA (guanine527-N7)-methyltransferase
VHPGFCKRHDTVPAPVTITITNSQISEALAPFEIAPTEQQISRIRDFLLVLLKWNRSISLTSIDDPIEIVTRHFGESMYASRLLAVENCRLADVGTGAGFPGLALKIADPSIRLTLIESNKKKAAFLSEAVRILGFGGVEIRPERYEEILPETILANIITARAVGDFKQLLRWSRNALARRGHLALWVGAEDSTRIVKSPGWTWLPAVRIPESQRRYILIGRPTDESGANS